MKKVILTGCIAAFTFLVGNVNAQTYAEVEKPADGTPWSIEVLMNTLSQDNTGVEFNSPALRARYFFNENIALRLQLGLGNGTGAPLSETNNFADPLGDGMGVQKINRMGVTIQLGAEYHFIGTRKLDPYAALGINFGGGNQKVEGTELSYTGPGNPPVYTEDSKYDTKGGFSVFGAKLGLGADFYFVENVYLGLEVGIGFGAINNKEREYNSTVTVGNTTTTTSTKVSGSKEA